MNGEYIVSGSESLDVFIWCVYCMMLFVCVCGGGVIVK